MRYYPRLRDLREDHDLTQTQLVEQLGIHKTTYTNYEQGKREPPFEFMIQLAEFYQVSLDYLAGGQMTFTCRQMLPLKIRPIWNGKPFISCILSHQPINCSGWNKENYFQNFTNKITSSKSKGI